MTPLQQELFDLLKDEVGEDMQEPLELDIQKLNAAELRHNIKVFTDQNDWLMNTKPPAGFPNA